MRKAQVLGKRNEINGGSPSEISEIKANDE
jgi:hypothetical protein